MEGCKGFSKALRLYLKVSREEKYANAACGIYQLRVRVRGESKSPHQNEKSKILSLNN